MRIAQVIGTVTLSHRHRSFQGATLKLAAPLSLDELGLEQEAEIRETRADEIVVFDELGAGVGDRIMLSEGGEAAQPFLPELKPVDAYNAALLDRLISK